MSKDILISLITTDLAKSTAFYSAVGFINKADTLDTSSGQMMWGDNITFMLLSPELAETLNERNKKIADQHTTVSVAFTLILETKEEVDQFCNNAKLAGGKVYTTDQDPDEFCYSFEVEDPDGYILQPTYMDTSKIPNSIN